MNNLYNGSSRKIPTSPSNPGGWSNSRPGSNNSYKSRWNNPDYCELRIKGWNSEVCYKGPNPKKHLEDALPTQRSTAREAFWYGLFTFGFSMLVKKYMPYGKAFLKLLFTKQDNENNETVIENSDEEEVAFTTTFITDFNSKFAMPSLPPFIDKIIKGVPKGYEIPMLFHLLSMLGGMCFSKVRSRYSDGNLHAPNFQVIIEGNFASGKGKFNDLYKKLFRRMIERSHELISSGEPYRIIQTTGIGTSMPRFIDVLADNQGCHMYIFNSELGNLANDMKKGNGLNFEILRHAYDNDPVCRNNRSNASQGVFPVFLNYTFTGTPDVVTKIFKNEIEDGTVSRICFTNIPEATRDLQALKEISEHELEGMKNQIDSWRQQYCFVEMPDNDLPVEEYELDLSYVSSALDEWLRNQYDQAVAEENSARICFRTRAAVNAFRAAIIFHLLWSKPSSKEYQKRRDVVNLSLYIANYCQERLIHKFGKEQNDKMKANKDIECVEGRPVELPKKSLVTDIAELARLHSIKDEKGNNKYGWDKLADMSGIPASTLRLKVKAYEERYNAGKQGVQDGC